MNTLLAGGCWRDVGISSDEALLAHIRAVYAEHAGAYGWPRVWRQLRAQGIRVGKQRVQRLMQQHGIRARGKRRFRYDHR